VKLKPAEQSLFDFHVHKCPVCHTTLVGIMKTRNHLRWHVKNEEMTEEQKKKFEEENNT
jgi:hypothetical protein